jgi:hypothetical protein
MISAKERKQQFIKDFQDLLDNYMASLDQTGYDPNTESSIYEIWMNTQYDNFGDVTHEYCDITLDELYRRTY